MQLYYGDTAALASMSAIDMFNTKETTKVTVANNMTIKNGRWYIYAITLTGEQAYDVNHSEYVGFKMANAENRTAIPMSVLRSKTNTFDNVYSSVKKTVQWLQGQVFVICGQTKTGTSVATYTGMWETESLYTAGNDDEVKIYVAVPKNAVNAIDKWNTGVEFYYGNDASYKNSNRLEMTKEPQLSINADYEGSTFVSGNYDVYSLTISGSDVRTIDDSKMVGFIKKGSYNRTYYKQSMAVTRASTVSDNKSYGLPQSIETFDSKTFIINGCANSGNERVTYTGWWS